MKSAIVLNAKCQAVKEVLENKHVMETNKKDAWTKVRSVGHSGQKSRESVMEHAFNDMLSGWALYADVHRATYESAIGEDYYIGGQWETMGASLRGLLDGDLGGIDCGDADGFIRAALLAEGFNEYE